MQRQNSLDSSLSQLGWLLAKTPSGITGSGAQPAEHSRPSLSNNNKSNEEEDVSKPAVSYARLIREAIEARPDRKCTLNGIYRHITERYAFYRRQPTGSWKNSIRHNLSMNRQFIKVPSSSASSRPSSSVYMSPKGGGYWAIASDQQQLARRRQSLPSAPSRPLPPAPRVNPAVVRLLRSHHHHHQRAVAAPRAGGSAECITILATEPSDSLDQQDEGTDEDPFLSAAVDAIAEATTAVVGFKDDDFDEATEREEEEDERALRLFDSRSAAQWSASFHSLYEHLFPPDLSQQFGGGGHTLSTRKTRSATKPAAAAGKKITTMAATGKGAGGGKRQTRVNNNNNKASAMTQQQQQQKSGDDDEDEEFDWDSLLV